jgi:transposase
MEVLYSRCCGLDVHKASVSACVAIREAGRTQKKYGRFGTMTRDLVGLAGWLHELGVTHVAMESTGVYWKPVWNVLEGQFQLILVNAQHVKNVPGRKTDVKDSEWIAELLQHGLLHPSFVPEIRIRDLRDLTRSRASLSEEASRIVSRIQKVLEDANVKLASVATNTVGKSGLAMLEALIAGESDSEALADLALGHLRAKIPQLRAALEAKVRDHHRFLLERLLLQRRFIVGEIAALDQRLEQIGAQEEPDLATTVARWVTVPGIDRVAAWSLVAEMGNNMAQFPTAAHLASWAGLCPGNYESAGKKLGATMRKGSPWLRRMACQSAWAAARADGLKRYLIRRLESLGHRVALLPQDAN